MSYAGWTREPPKEAGWYWQRVSGGEPALPVRIARKDFGATLYALVRGNESPQNWRYKVNELTHVEWWPHPIAPPRDDVVKEEA